MTDPIDLDLEARLSAEALHPIGYLRTPFAKATRTPRQRWEAEGDRGALVVLEQYAAGLAGLEGFDWVHVIARFDQLPEPDPEHDPLTRRPLLLPADAEPVGVFATRHPDRPNRLALSLLRVRGIEGRVIHFTGIDLADRTPVLDIKPFEARHRRAGLPPRRCHGLDGIRSGWYDTTDATGRHGHGRSRSPD